jgi:VIT1/CCC1 family predicted Fe2+/Mn2+ transporter
VLSTTDISRYRVNLQDEVDSAAIYRAMADRERKPQLAQFYVRMAEAEERHARFWEQLLQQNGQPAGRHPSWRSKALVFLVRRFGARLVLPTMATMEQLNRHVYDKQPEAGGTSMPAQERSHARLLRALAGRETLGLSGDALARIEGRHRALAGNALRAAVLGANDGLLSNLSLVMGVAGAQVGGQGILITGLAGLLAGAFSMALGEWISVQSSRELFERQLSVERDEIALVPDEEKEELALIYESKGIPAGEARALAERLMSQESTAIDALAREELGIDPEQLGGSAWAAAITSFLLFAVGALVPVVPFLFLSGGAAVATSLCASAVALFLLGAGITLMTGRSVWRSGLRQLLIGLSAALITYGLGRLLNASLT